MFIHLSRTAAEGNLVEINRETCALCPFAIISVWRQNSLGTSGGKCQKQLLLLLGCCCDWDLRNMGSCNGMLLKLTEEKKSFKRTLQATKMEIQRQPNESFFQVCELIILIIDLEGKQRDASMLRYSSGLLGRFQFKDKAKHANWKRGSQCHQVVGGGCPKEGDGKFYFHFRYKLCQGHKTLIFICIPIIAFFSCWQ